MQLGERNLTDAEVARRGGISQAAISRARHGRLPGWTVCVGLAKGLGLPAEIVLRAAGHLPPDPNLDSDWVEFNSLWARATEAQKEEVLRFIRYIIENRK